MLVTLSPISLGYGGDSFIGDWAAVDLICLPISQFYSLVSRLCQLKTLEADRPCYLGKMLAGDVVRQDNVPL